MNNSFITRTKADFDAMAHTHDVHLPSWGPYSADLAGIVHTADPARGAGFHLSVFPRYYHGTAHLPTEQAESFHFPWFATEDLSLYTYRFEMEWKDRVYCDISYIRVHEDAYLIEIEAHNNTGSAQQLGLHYLSSMQFPTAEDGSYAVWAKPVCEGNFFIRDGADYSTLSLANPEKYAHLPLLGRKQGEITGEDMVGGRALGGPFAHTAGDRAEYDLIRPVGENLQLTLRAEGHATLALSGIAEGEITLDSDTFAAYTLPVSADPAVYKLVITCVSGCGAVIDTIAVSDAPVTFAAAPPAFTPQIRRAGETLTLSYGNGHEYGIAWRGYDAAIRELLGSDWEAKTGMPHKASHEYVGGNGQAHYTDLYVRPLFLSPYETRKIYSFVCHSTTESARLPDHFSRWAEMDHAVFAQRALDKIFANPLPPDEYALSQQLLRAATLTNIVYPFRDREGFVRRFTGAKPMQAPSPASLGMISLGLVPQSPDLALEVLNSLLMPVKEDSAPFMHSGDPTPTAAYAYKALWDATHSRAFLASFYPRLQQYYRFLMGRSHASPLRQMKSGILNSRVIEYSEDNENDTPVYEEIQKRGLANRCSTNELTTHAIVFARILRHASVILGYHDEAEYDADIASLGSALQAYAYDRRSGYFGAITHDEGGNPEGFLRTERFVNYNMGVDGALVLLSGICNPRQESVLSGFMMDPARMWTDCGIAEVDRSAPYYRRDGFRNGTSRIHHQWFAFLGMLNCGRIGDAFKIAATALDTWKNEVGTSYNCCDHFVLETGRGGGWHCSSDSTAPLSLWYHALYTPGTVTAPPDVFVTASNFGDGYSCADLTVDAGNSHHPETSLLVSLANDDYRIMVNGNLAEGKHAGCAIAVRIPTGRISHISIYPR